jgi:hypothetical protein
VCRTYLLPSQATLLAKGFRSWAPGFAVMVGVSIAWAFAIRLVSLKGMYRIMKYG